MPEAGTKEKSFTFAIWGDPQVAYYEEGNSEFGGGFLKRISEEVNPRFSRSVELTNRLNPDFVITLGDNVHGGGEWEHFKVFVDLVRPLRSPLYLLMGNHDQVPRVDQDAGNPNPGREFGNFFWAQKQTGGAERVAYSFNGGDWHFLLYSEPGGNGPGVNAYMNRHSEYFQWLEEDLKANRDRPTFFFTHHPLLPVGRDQIDKYGPNAAHRARLMNILTRYGNVKYAFFGHVHNTVSSIDLTSWRYRGTNFILLPNTAFFTRDYFYQEEAKSSWGVATVQINGKVCQSIRFHTLTGDIIEIDPSRFQEYDDSPYGYLTPDSDLPANEGLVNGGFEQPLSEGWFLNYMLPYESSPIQKRMLLSQDAPEGRQSLYLYIQAHSSDNRRESNYLVSEVRQAVAAPRKNSQPELHLRYKIDSKQYRNPELCNAYISISGHKKIQDDSVFTLVYSLGSEVDFYGKTDPYVCLQQKPILDQWTELSLNIRSDYDQNFTEIPWDQLEMNSLVLRLGVYNRNYWIEDQPTEIGIHFDALRWIPAN